jgi:hypothetical protein
MTRRWTTGAIPGLARMAAVILGLLLAASAQAGEPLAKPSGTVILTISGAIDVTNAPGQAEFDLEMLKAIGVDHMTTTTNWTDGKKVFEGVLVSKLLAAVGAHGKTASAAAIDDYVVELPTDEFARYPVLLAWSMDGQMMTARDKGPLWIVYPRDDYPELADPKLVWQWVWGLKSLAIK